jgi:hypothetical protein
VHIRNDRSKVDVEILLMSFHIITYLFLTQLSPEYSSSLRVEPA